MKTSNLDLQALFNPAVATEAEHVIKTSRFRRRRHATSNAGEVILDSFPDLPQVTCAFFRLPPGQADKLRLEATNIRQMKSCASGGWLLHPVSEKGPSYWIPRSPILRQLEEQGRITAETDAPITGVGIGKDTLAIEVDISENHYLDLVVWKFHPSSIWSPSDLEKLLTLETQPFFFWTSQTTYQVPADTYLYLIHGQVYTNRFIWPRHWKICSELDAYGLYVTFNGLEKATGKALYGLLKRQLVYSVVARQSEDGGWYQGEWTDLMESHYRFHNGAILMLESVLEEHPDDLIRESLEKAVAYSSRHTDQTNIGLWFLHDSLEESVEGMNLLWKQTGARWLPSRTLGKSKTNKLILNTHLDTIITLQRFQEITDNHQYSSVIESALKAARTALSMQPAETLYRWLYHAIGWTLLPEKRAQRLPLLKRALKRLSSNYLIPQLHRIKKHYPRFVMPNGLVDRHIAPLHFNIQYHSVNTMDLARFWQRFPEEDIEPILHNAVEFVSTYDTLKYWSEAPSRKYALVVWADALYRLCLLKPDLRYRQQLAKTILHIEDTNQGLPPVLLGNENEAISPEKQRACPSPTKPQLRMVNLCNGKSREWLVVNVSSQPIVLEWENEEPIVEQWHLEDNTLVGQDSSTIRIPARSWARGLGE